MSILRYTLLILLVLLLPRMEGLQAQDMSWGIKAGLNSSGVTTDNVLVVGNEPKLGWGIGLFSKTNKVGWGFTVEGNLNTLGSKQRVGDESQKNTIGYLSLPLGLQYTLSNNISFNLGGYVSFRLWAHRKASKTGVGEVVSNINENVTFVDYGPWASIGYRVESFFFDLRYLRGIPNINKNATINAKAFNYSIQFAIGYSWK